MTSDPWQVAAPRPPAAGPAVQWGPPEPAVRWREDSRDFAFTVVLVVLTAPLVGLLWSAIGPKLALRSALGGSESAFRSELGADVHFVLLTAAAGIVCAAVAIALHRDGPGVTLGLAVGGLLAALVVDRVGYLLNRDHTLAVLHHLGVSLSELDQYGIDPFFKVRALGVIVAWPIAAVATHTIALAIRGPRSLP